MTWTRQSPISGRACFARTKNGSATFATQPSTVGSLTKPTPCLCSSCWSWTPICFAWSGGMSALAAAVSTCCCSDDAHARAMDRAAARTAARRHPARMPKGRVARPSPAAAPAGAPGGRRTVPGAVGPGGR